jgi:hypothetical protein
MEDLRRSGLLAWGVDVCRQFARDAVARPMKGADFPEPYISCVPQDWNGVLVLGIAHNLGRQAGNDGDFRSWYESLKPEERFTHLYTEKGAREGPWCWPEVRLAMKAIGVDGEIGFGNAVPWSRCDDEGNNDDPTTEMKRRATEFWKILSSFWQPGPRLVVTLGKDAEQVLGKLGGWASASLPLVFPS